MEEKEYLNFFLWKDCRGVCYYAANLDDYCSLQDGRCPKEKVVEEGIVMYFDDGY